MSVLLAIFACSMSHVLATGLLFECFLLRKSVKTLKCIDVDVEFTFPRGSGSGLLALMALKLGARKVIAIEATLDRNSSTGRVMLGHFFSPPSCWIICLELFRGHLQDPQEAQRTPESLLVAFFFTNTLVASESLDTDTKSSVDRKPKLVPLTPEEGIEADGSSSRHDHIIILSI